MGWLGVRQAEKGDGVQALGFRWHLTFKCCRCIRILND